LKESLEKSTKKLKSQNKNSENCELSSESIKRDFKALETTSASKTGLSSLLQD